MSANIVDQKIPVVWHALPAQEALARLDSNAQSGLTAAEVSHRLAKYGRNQLPEGRKKGPFMRFLSQFHNILIYVLFAAGFTKLMLGLWLDAAVILGVVVINSHWIRFARCCLRRPERCATLRLGWYPPRNWFPATSYYLSRAIGFPLTFGLLRSRTYGQTRRP